MYNFFYRIQHVITAVSIDSFKNRLEKFWTNEEARYSRSTCTVTTTVLRVF